MKSAALEARSVQEDSCAHSPASSRALPAKVVQMMFGEPSGTSANLCCQSKL